MNWLTILTTIFYIVWLIAVLVLLWRIWISSEQRLKHVNVLEQALLDVSTKNADSARRAVDDVHVLVEMLQKEPQK